MCTRALWAGNGQAILVGRNMDWPWPADMQTDLWAFPRGIARVGLGGDGNPVTWTSKYGSVAASSYNVSTADGINEKGLVAGDLWLTETDYGKRDPRVPGLSSCLWTQYMLDNFATVAEAIDAMQPNRIQIVPPGAPSSAHEALADASGDSAIIEIIDGGKFRIHHDRAYTVMTNSPPFPQQLANLKKYQGFGGSEPLPGTNEPADRFVRAAYYLKKLAKPKDLREAIAAILSVMRTVAQPFIEFLPAHPEASHTIWRTVADATHHLYFCESMFNPNIVWVRLDDLDFNAGAPVRKLDLVHSGDLVGDVTASFKPSAPLAFRISSQQ